MQISRNIVNGQKVIIRFWWKYGLSSASRNHLTTFYRPFAHYGCFKIVFRDSSLHPKQFSLFCLLWLMSANFAKALVWKTQTWRHKQPTPNINDTIRNHPMKIFCVRHWFCCTPSKVGDEITPRGPRATSGPLSRGCRNQQNSPRQSFVGHSGHMDEQTQLRSLYSEKWLTFSSSRPWCRRQGWQRTPKSFGLVEICKNLSEIPVKSGQIASRYEQKWRPKSQDVFLGSFEIRSSCTKTWPKIFSGKFGGILAKSFAPPKSSLLLHLWFTNCTAAQFVAKCHTVNSS